MDGACVTTVGDEDALRVGTHADTPKVSACLDVLICRGPIGQVFYLLAGEVGKVLCETVKLILCPGAVMFYYYNAKLQINFKTTK